MKQFFQNTFTKLKDYFTANTGRKIFFFGLVFMTLISIIYLALRLVLISAGDNLDVFFIQEILIILRYLGMLSLLVVGAGTLWDSMQSRVYFLERIREIQYQHLKEVYDKQAAGEMVEMTATFTDEENRYLRRRKWGFVFTILFKVGLMIALFSLLLAV